MFTVALFFIESEYNNPGGMVYVGTVIADVVGTLGLYNFLENLIK